VDNLWPQTITAAATLLAAFGVVLLTQRHARRIRDDDRDEDHKAIQRAAVVDVLDWGHKWVIAVQGQIMMIATVTDAVEMTNTWTWNRGLEVGDQYQRALVAARLTVTTRRAASLINALSTKRELEEFTAPIFRSTREKGKADAELVGQALGFVDQYKRALDELEAAAVKDLAPRLTARSTSQ
jgi:hypothetical protein